MRARRVAIVVVGLSVWGLVGCFPPCPAEEASTASVTDVEGQIVSDGVAAGPYTYAVTHDYVDGEECRASTRTNQADGADVVSQSRPWLELRCPTSMVPLLQVRLPDLRSSEASADPIAATVDVTQNTEYDFWSGCEAQWLDVPVEVTVLEAVGGPAPEHPYVTADFEREALVHMAFDPGAQPGVDVAGDPCVSDVPPFTLDLSVRMTEADFGHPGAGCG